MSQQKVTIIDGKRWAPNIQDWSFAITIAWMTIANIWKPFGLFGFVCMFTPILIAASGRGKMHCARICPRGSLVGKVCSHVNLGLKKPAIMNTSGFKTFLWALMMGSFAVVLVLFIPQGLEATGNAILVFMEVATALAILSGILFTPRAWCTYCPMGTTTGRIRGLRKALESRPRDRQMPKDTVTRPSNA